MRWSPRGATSRSAPRSSTTTWPVTSTGGPRASLTPQNRRRRLPSLPRFFPLSQVAEFVVGPTKERWHCPAAISANRVVIGSPPLLEGHSLRRLGGRWRSFCVYPGSRWLAPRCGTEGPCWAWRLWQHRCDFRADQRSDNRKGGPTSSRGRGPVPGPVKVGQNTNSRAA
jgi:hypothetical protein